MNFCFAVGLSCLLAASCKMPRSQDNDSVKSLSDTTAIVNNHDGTGHNDDTFTVTCKNGTKERKVTAAQLGASPNMVCGGTNNSQIMCTADGYAGSTIESAIRACEDAGRQSRTCSSNVTCTGNVQMCKASGCAGSFIETAIQACEDAGIQPRTCSSNVTCLGNVPMCKASGCAGSTVESAIKACEDAGIQPGTCSSSVTCGRT